MGNLRVSIITAVYNRKETIERTILSVLSQKYSKIEYIVVDGLSVDGSLEIINGYKDKISLLISEKDDGIYDALNKGIMAATGDVIGFIHSDDYLMHDAVIQQMVDAIDNPQHDIVYANLEFFNKDSGNVVRFFNSGFFKPWMMRFTLQPAHPTVYARRSVYQSVGLFDSRYRISADFDWLLRAIYLQKCNIQHINSTWVRMQVGGASTKGINAVFNHNSEDLGILKNHKVYSNWILILMKYTIKIFQMRI